MEFNAKVEKYGLWKREYKTIIPQRILNLEETGLELELLGEDEIFVRVIEFVGKLWVSNYGRIIWLQDGVYSLLTGEIVQGRLIYNGLKWSALIDGKWKMVEGYARADALVASTFIVNADVVYNDHIWHKNNDYFDNYYKHLYPVTVDQCCEIFWRYEETGDDSEKVIEDIMNAHLYKFRGWCEEEYKPTVRGKGYHGIIKEREHLLMNTKGYTAWSNMMNRPGSNWRYMNVTVSLEWRSSSNFCSWYDKNFYKIPGVKMEIDKDLLYHGNIIYDSQHCVYLPQEINNALVLESGRGKGKKRDLPVGVVRLGNRFKATVSENNKNNPLGIFDTPEEAFAAYKEEKEKIIKRLAEKYKAYLPPFAYQALMEWTVNIDD